VKCGITPDFDPPNASAWMSPALRVASTVGTAGPSATGFEIRARELRNAPRFTLTAMLVLVLGIGVPLTAFRVVLRDLQGGSAPDPDSLVRLTRRAPGAHMTSLTYPELAFYAANAKSFRNVIGVSGRKQAFFSEAAAGSAPESIHAAFATSNYFPESGAAPTTDGSASAPPKVFGGTYSFWSSRR
jgi:hypothetical protein